jgi:hypothetical protein
VPDRDVEVIPRRARIPGDVVPGVGGPVFEENHDERQSRFVEHFRRATGDLPDRRPVAVVRSPRGARREHQGSSHCEGSEDSSHAPLFMELLTASTHLGEVELPVHVHSVDARKLDANDHPLVVGAVIPANICSVLIAHLLGE